MNEKKIPEQIIELIRTIDNFVLATHVHPDGDAIGSLLGMADILDCMGKRVFAYLEEPVSHLYDFLPDCGRVEHNLTNLQRFIDEGGGSIGVIALDCGEADRLGEQKNRLLTVHPFIVVDHHVSHRNYGDYRWVEAECSSTGEMVYEIAETLGVKPSEKCAYDLFAAIATDTGSFRYECTKARTLEVASKLVKCGAQPAEVAKHIYDNYSIERLKLMELVLGTLELCEQGQVAFIHVSREMFERSGACPQDVEGFVDYPRAIRNVRVAVFIKENKSGMISVSLRAKGECDVAEIAKLFNGGGHRNAAGCRFFDTSLEAVRKQLRSAVASCLAGKKSTYPR